METYGLIDNRNIDLWETLNKEFEITIVTEDRDTYAVYTRSGKATISIPIDKADSSSFTHELLQIYMKKKEVFIGGGLKLSVMGDDVLSKFMSEDLIEHIGNSLEHIKMLPLFLEMSFNREEFISDYLINKLTDENLKSIKRFFKSKSLFQREKYNSKAVDFFIGKYFAVKACPNLTYNYDKGLNELGRIDADLYSVLEKFMKSWDMFDYNNTDPITGGYHDILFDFVSGLTEWSKGKSVV
jgi:hypothetical protein